MNRKEPKDERIAKPGGRASIVFIVVFLIILLWFGRDGAEEAQGSELTGSPRAPLGYG